MTRSAPTPLDWLHDCLCQQGVGPATRLAVACSGGLDSTALLHAVHQLQPAFGFHLQAVHVHHGLQAQADAWAEHCARMAAALAVPFRCLHVHVAPAAGQGLEAAARQARYQALAACKADYLLLAHHANDQAETVLLALLRGAGPAGLAAMSADQVPPAHPLHARLLRPWLAVPREQLLDWARQQALDWVEDPTNQQDHLDRNFLRLQVGPQLANRFPGWRQSLARSAAWAAEAQELLQALARLDLAAFDPLPAEDPDPACLPGPLAQWQQLTPARQRNLLRLLVQQRGLPAPPAVRLAAWCAQLQAAADRLPTLVWQDCVLRRWGGRLWLEHAADPGWTDGSSLDWPGVQDSAWLAPAGGCLRMQAIPAASQPAGAHFLLGRPLRADCGPLQLRWQGGHDRIQMHPGGPHRDLRKLFQERAVPPWRRGWWPRLYAGRQLVAVAGLATANGWQAGDGDGGWQLVWQPAAPDLNRLPATGFGMV